MRGVDVSTRVVIARPRAKVAAFAADPDNATRWYRNIKSVAWRTERPLQVGSRVAFVADFLGRELSYTYEVVVFAPDEKLVMRTSEGPFPMETSYEWEDCDAGSTLMTLRNRGVPAGFAAIFAPIMSAAIGRANTRDLEALKLRLEL